MNPTRGIRIRGGGVRHRFALTEQQLDTLLRHAEQVRPDLAPIYASCALAGLRIGEALALQRGDVELEKGVLHVRRSVLENGVLNRTPKNGQARSIVIPPKLCAVLAEPVSRARLWLFPNRRGEARRYSGVWIALQRIAHQAGIPPLGLHDLRRSYASLLMSKQAHPEFVRQQLGHSTLAQTSKYAGFLPAAAPDWFDRFGHGS